jgi:hypothetical protein
MTGQEKFRVFRLDEGTPVYVGTFTGTSKDAIKKGIYADGSDGEQIYEAHVLRNASVFDTRSRLEHYIDSVTPINTQEFVANIDAA